MAAIAAAKRQAATAGLDIEAGPRKQPSYTVLRDSVHQIFGRSPPSSTEPTFLPRGKDSGDTPLRAQAREQQAAIQRAHRVQRRAGEEPCPTPSLSVLQHQLRGSIPSSPYIPSAAASAAASPYSVGSPFSMPPPPLLPSRHGRGSPERSQSISPYLYWQSTLYATSRALYSNAYANFCTFFLSLSIVFAGTVLLLPGVCCASAESS